MNKQRKKMIKDGYDLIMQAKSLIDTAIEEEQEAFDNLPESLQLSERGEEMEENVEQLQECSDNLEEAINALEEQV